MSDLTGRTIGQYQLVETIDQSGITHIYKGFQASTERYVAVKVLSPSSSGDKVLVQRFQTQANLQTRYEHRYLLPIYDHGLDKDVYYRVSRYLENGALQDHLDRFRDINEAQKLIKGIAEGLEYIHSQGHVDGNLNPSNVLLDDQYQPLLTDFGLTDRMVVLSDPYVSPEQGKGAAIDKRTDVYALGVLLYHLLVGEAPDAGLAVSPLAKRPDIPKEVEKIVLKAMAINPDQRYQSASAFSAALDQALVPDVQPPEEAQVQTAASPPPPAEKKKDHSWLIFLLGGLFVIIIIACGLIVVPSLIDSGETATPEPEETAEVEPTEPPADTEAPPPTEEPTEAPQPTGESPEAVQPTIEPTEEGGRNIGDICGSVGFIGGALMFGLVFTRRRKLKHPL